MKTKLKKLALLALLPVALLTYTSCSTTGQTESSVMYETPGGAAIVDTIKATATVTGIDATTRQVTLRMAGAKTTTVKCGPEVVNFSQIQRNDRVNITYTEELAVFLGAGGSPKARGAAAVALAPRGAKPGGYLANTVSITAKIMTINTQTRKVTLELPDGSMKTIKAGKNVNLNEVRPGDTVTVDYTESLAITVERA